MSLNLHLTLSAGKREVSVDLAQTPTVVSKSIANWTAVGKEPSFTKYHEWLGSRPGANDRPLDLQVKIHRETLACLQEQGSTKDAQAMAESLKELEAMNLSRVEQSKLTIEGIAQCLAQEEGVPLESLTWNWWIL